MNISIYLGPLKGEKVDASNIDKGNPGVGGTQYCMLELANYLYKQNDYNITVLASREYTLVPEISFNLIEGDKDVCRKAAESHTDILILSQFNNKQLEEDIAEQNYKVIIWTHNYIFSPFCDFISNTKQIICNVFVGKQLYDRYIDDDVINKSVYIYNMYADKYSDIVREDDHRTVVYMGAIIPGKGFSELCSIWGKVLEKVPDAKLIVMGSGKLYGDAKLGRLGIASETYENSFAKYITDSEGNIIPSVRFMGVVGSGKEAIFRKASVGVVNPSGRTETFGMGVLEMGEAKLPVVTIGKNGYFDTVNSGKSGILSKSLSSMPYDIVKLLQDTELNKNYGEEAKKNNQRFLPSVIGPQWEELLNFIYNDSISIKSLKASQPYKNNIKWLRCVLRFLRFDLHLKFLPSLIRMETLAYKMLYR